MIFLGGFFRWLLQDVAISLANLTIDRPIFCRIYACLKRRSEKLLVNVGDSPNSKAHPPCKNPNGGNRKIPQESFRSRWTFHRLSPAACAAAGFEHVGSWRHVRQGELICWGFVVDIYPQWWDFTLGFICLSFGAEGFDDSTIWTIWVCPRIEGSPALIANLHGENELSLWMNFVADCLQNLTTP